MHQHPHHRGLRRRRERTWNLPNMGKEIIKSRKQSPRQNNPRRSTPRHLVTKPTNIKDRDKTLKTTGELPTDYQLLSQQKLCKPEKEWHNIFKEMKRKNLQPKSIPSKALIQIWWKNQKLTRQAKVKRIQHRQTSFTTHAKGTSLGRKQKTRKRTTENKPTQLRQW